MDILGFSEIVRNSVSSPKQARELIDILNNISNIRQEFVGEHAVEDDDFKAQSFSDCFVLSENASPRGLLHILAASGILALNLLSNGIFARGGVAKGKLYHSDKVAFGPAPLDAYRLESTIAKYPRVLVDRAVHADYTDPQYAVAASDYRAIPKLKFDLDGPPFLDILEAIREAGPDRADDIEGCRGGIQKALEASVYEPQHFEKVNTPPPKGGGFRLRLEAGLIDPSGRPVQTTLKLSSGSSGF